MNWLTDEALWADWYIWAERGATSALPQPSDLRDPWNKVSWGLLIAEGKLCRLWALWGKEPSVDSYSGDFWKRVLRREGATLRLELKDLTVCGICVKWAAYDTLTVCVGVNCSREKGPMLLQASNHRHVYSLLLLCSSSFLCRSCMCSCSCIDL